ncbi:SDR family NAD(P)-dependent oxidoreductase [Geodermatophilus sp. FMUSA9-8]|uniref:SDR family NAD(P)-dependent oxidoreductase n=1 Tax=Geodermatophilus sp. FMUSA9-8 TaxID=3120155 RepID=UPI00300B4370
MTTTLITGANKGIGYETARRLVGAGHDVWVGARDAERGRAAADRIGARAVQLDVTDDTSVSAALEAIADQAGRLDVLVNNAGIPDNTVGVEGISGATALAVLNTNVAGVVRVTQAALPLLRSSDRGSIVNVSSGLGSFGANTDPARPESQTPLIVYAASKAAVAMLTLKYAQALPGLRVNAACPGLTATDFAAGFPGAQPVEDAVGVIVDLACAGLDGRTGTVLEAEGPLAW